MLLIQFSNFDFSTKMEIFVLKINDSQPLTVVTKNSILDAADVLDPLDRL